MNYLIDTHVLLWGMIGDNRLKPEIINIIDNSDNTIFLSNVSLWEISIKISIGKLKLNGTMHDLRNYLEQARIEILQFDYDDLDMLQKLPHHHQDPFDRLIVAQAKTKFLEIISNDKQVHKYFE